MSHDTNVTINTAYNNVVIIDSEQNQISISHPITQVIEVTAQPISTVTVIEETPNQVTVSEPASNTITVSANGPQGIQGIQGPVGPIGPIGLSAPFTKVGTTAWATTSSLQLSSSITLTNNTSLNLATSTGTSIQSLYMDVNNNVILKAPSAGDYYFYEGNNALARFVNGGNIHLGGTSVTSAPLMRITPTQVMINRGITANFSLHTGGTFGLGTGGTGGGTSAAFTYDGINNFTFRNSGGDNGLSITTNINANNIQAIIRPIVASSNSGFALAPGSASNANANHLVIGGLHPEQRPNIGIGTFTPFVSASLTVSGGVILNGTSSYFTNYEANPVQLHSGKTGNAIGIYSDVVNQYAFTDASPYYQFGFGGSATWRLATSTNQGFLIQNVQPGLNTRVYVSASGFVGIGTSTPLSNLHVLKGLSGAPLLGLDDGITLTLENDTTNFINFRSPNAVAAGLAFTTPADNSAGYITLRQDTGEMYYSTENSNGYHRFIIGSTERLRINNAGLIVTGSSLLLGNQTITGSFSVSGSTLQTGNNTLIGNTVLSGSIEVSGSSNFHNSSFTVTGSSNFKGDINFDGNVNVVYSSSFYHWGNKLFNYGAFSDTTSQSGSANTAYLMTFNTNDVVGYGVNIVSQSRITVDHTGLYNVQFSTQLDRVAGSGNALVSIWLRVTGSDVANSCTDVALTGNAASAASVAAWNFVFPMSASQYCELAWSTTDANIHISAIGTRTDPIRPAVPSVILTVTQIA